MKNDGLCMNKVAYCVSITLIFLFTALDTGAQELTSEMLEKSAIRFTLNESGQFESKARDQWFEWIDDNQFVGLAEVHNSAQLSFFTKALLNVLKEKEFEHFAMEMGPNTASILQEKTVNTHQILNNLKELNRKYGKRAQSKTPLVFVNKIEDAVFVEEAARLDFTFWGLDQEFVYSYEMLIDYLYELSPGKNTSFDQAYREAKSTIRKVIFKNRFNGEPTQCWLPKSDELNRFFDLCDETEQEKVIADIRKSWEIYCEYYNGGSNRMRANYMKMNVDSYLEQYGVNTKVFAKLGGVHLTRGISPFGVDDVGKHLTEKAERNSTEFLTIRHLIAYRNGKSNIGKSGWKSVGMFLELGKRDQWTVVDLRPFRAMLEKGEITTNKKFAFELKSYDLLLLSPDDQYPKVNY